MTIATLVAATIALCAIVSALLVAQSCKRLTSEAAAMSESISIYADRLQGLADRLLPLEAAVRHMEAEVHRVGQSFTVPNDLFPMGPQPLHDSDEVTPAHKPKKGKRK